MYRMLFLEYKCLQIFRIVLVLHIYTYVCVRIYVYIYIHMHIERVYLFNIETFQRVRFHIQMFKR